MPYCAIITCKHDSRIHNIHNGGISYHRFPHDADIKDKWIKATGRKNWFPSKFSTVCSNHFNNHEWNIKKSLRYLKPGAIPSLDVWMQQVSKPSQNQIADQEADSSSCSDESVASGSEGEIGRGGEGACVACSGAVGKFGRRVRGSPAEQFIQSAIFPREINENTLLCTVCYERYCNKGKRKGRKIPRKSSQSKSASQGGVSLSDESTNANVSTSTQSTSNLTAAAQQTITLASFKRAPCRFECCLFPNCQMKTLHIISQYEKQCLLRDYKLYTPEHSRICQEHLFSKKWEPVLNIAKSDFTSQQIEDVISILTTNVTAYNFDNIEEVPPNLLLYCTGMNHIQLRNILDKLPSLKKKTKTPVLALTAYLTKLRTNDSFDRLSILFQNKKSMLENFTTIAKICMLHELVPSSEKTKRASSLTADDPVRHYLQEHYYGDAATTKEHIATHTSSEILATSKPIRCRKRKSSSDLDDDSLARAQKRLEKDKRNEYMENEREQYALAKAGVKSESPGRADAGIMSASSDDEELSEQPREKEVPDDEGEAVTEEDTEEQHLVYAPELTEDLLADPLEIDAVPAPILEQVKSEEDPIIVNVESGERELPTAGTSLEAAGDSSFTVYYTKGVNNFVQELGPKL